MPDVNEGGDTTDAPTTPQADQFGVTLNPDGSEFKEEEPTAKLDKDGKPVIGKDGKPEYEVPKAEAKKEEGKTKEEGGDEIANHPVVKALEAKITEYGTNLTGQRDAHDKVVNDLKKQLADALAGKDPSKEAEPMFKDIKFSKDLSKDQLEDMTDADIRSHDANAQMQVGMNLMLKQIADNKTTSDTATDDATKATEEQKVTDLNTSAQAEAGRVADEAIAVNPELAKDAKALKDLIIVEFNEFNNIGLTPEKLIERMKKALNNVTGYTPPKEKPTETADGKAVKDNTGGKDTSVVDGIIKGASKENKGSYSL